MKKNYLLIALLALIMLGASADSAKACVKDSLFIRVNGTMRNMIVFTPDNMKENLPLMIVTHGMNQDPHYQYTSDRLWELIDSDPFVVAYLRSNGSQWDTGGTNDQHFVEQAIGEMYALHKIDPHRVYWSGFSMGSMLMYHSMHNMTGKIAAFAPCSGIQFSEQPWNKVKGPINLIHCHAYGDDVFGYDQYGIRDYVVNMVKVNGESTYTKQTNYYTVFSWNTGDKEVWTNAAGNKIELYAYNNGGHWPTKNNAVELWNFCKQFRLENIDPVPEPEQPINYTIDPESERKQKAERLSGQVIFPTDESLQAMMYVNNAIESPQNVRSGVYADISDNPHCWFRFSRVSDAKCKTTGYLYTIQFVTSAGAPYELWGSQGYLNAQPNGGILFALGLTNNGTMNYGQDGPYTGLWLVNYEEGRGYTIQNVNNLEAGAPSYLSLKHTSPQAEKHYIRFFKQLQEVKPTDIEAVTITSSPSSSDHIYDVLGQRVTNPRPGTIYIRNGKKFVAK